MLLIRKANNLAIDICGAPGSDFSAADRDNCLCHLFILALKLNQSLFFLTRRCFAPDAVAQNKQPASQPLLTPCIHLLPPVSFSYPLRHFAFSLAPRRA